MGATKMGTTKKSATKPNKRFWEGGIFRVMKQWIPNKLKMRTMAAVARKHLRVISTNKKHHKHATVATDSADNRVVEEPKPTHDEDNATNDEATEDATIGDAVADEPPEVGTFAAHHTNNEHHEDATVAADSADNQAKASEDMTTVHGIADEPSEDGYNSNVNEASRDTNTGNGIADEPCEDEEAPEFNGDGDNSTDHEAPGDTNAENGTVDGLTEAQTSSASHAQDGSRIPQPPVGRTAAQERRTMLMRRQHRMRHKRYLEDCKRRGVKPAMPR
ncbi:unnamed protein product [Fusarium equiseti]|uniref:Uncharacterized protein n=1 Tax=Fusarium equiseti TaxID=61235 RepID=A0A8J2IIM1_FUSEQ|nr:unnamed protein product [Fusarium equiseti]